MWCRYKSVCEIFSLLLEFDELNNEYSIYIEWNLMLCLMDILSCNDVAFPYFTLWSIFKKSEKLSIAAMIYFMLNV